MGFGICSEGIYVVAQSPTVSVGVYVYRCMCTMPIWYWGIVASLMASMNSSLGIISVCINPNSWALVYL